MSNLDSPGASKYKAFHYPIPMNGCTGWLSESVA